jgi:hypothetical protein
MILVNLISGIVSGLIVAVAAYVFLRKREALDAIAVRQELEDRQEAVAAKAEETAQKLYDLLARDKELLLAGQLLVPGFEEEPVSVCVNGKGQVDAIRRELRREKLANEFKKFCEEVVNRAGFPGGSIP